MKTTLLAFLAAATLAVGLGSSHAASASVSVFYESLEPYGEWMDTSDYGYIWHPRDVDDRWRPYTVGHWAYTDAGWTWVSEEPFGWATYHYGRWVEIDRVGWSWVPDREWGPAWVSWRRSDRHVGWAPLPPEARFESSRGIHEWSDSYYDIGPASYSFVSVRDFGSPRLRTVIVEPRENITIISETRNITRITYVNNIVVNNGPDYQVIVRDSAQPIRRLKLERRTDVDYRPGSDRSHFRDEISGETLRVAAPQIEISRDVAPRQVARKLQSVEVNRGWSKGGDPQATERLRAKMASEARPPADLPPLSRTPRTGRAAEGERPAAKSDGSVPPAVTATAETPAPDREGKPKAKPSAAKGDAGQTPAAAPEVKTADQARPGSKKPGSKKESSTAPGVGEAAPATPDRKSAPEAADRPGRPKASAEKAAETPGPSERPGAPREKGPKRPEAKPTEPAAAPEPRPDGEKPKKKDNAKAEKPERGTPERNPGNRPSNDRPAGDQPRAASPDKPEKPVKNDSPDKPERKGPPSADRSAPPAREAASPERAKPEGVDRSRESRPSAPAPGVGEPPKKEGKASEKRGEKEEKKEKDKN